MVNPVAKLSPSDTFTDLSTNLPQENQHNSHPDPEELVGPAPVVVVVVVVLVLVALWK